jgi:hypothetical protein
MDGGVPNFTSVPELPKIVTLVPPGYSVVRAGSLPVPPFPLYVNVYVPLGGIGTHCA